MTPTRTDPLATRIRIHQKANPTFGAAYDAIYEMADRVRLGHFSRDDGEKMPWPIVRFGVLGGSRLAEYARFDGTFHTVITIDPNKFHNLLETVEYLAHEYVHLWMDWLRYPHDENGGHGPAFITAVAEMGLSVDFSGEHFGYHGDVWHTWLKEANQDLDLGRFLLADKPKRPSRKQTYECPSCGLTIRHKKTDLELMCFHGLEIDAVGYDTGAVMKLRDTLEA